MEDLVAINIYPTDVSRTTRIGVLLQDERKAQLENFLKGNTDVFAWSHDEMPRIEAEVLVHRLNIDPKFKPIQ